MPGPSSPASCYLVESDGFRLLLDLGHGSLGALQNYIGVDEIDAIALSHLHADHCMDLTALYVARVYGDYDITSRLPVYGPSSTADRMADAYGLPRATGMHSTFDFQDLALVTTIGPFQFRSTRVAHPVEAHAIRLEADGLSLTYSADTGPCPDLVTLADGTDLLLCEASLPEVGEHPINLHLTGGQAGEVATKASAKQLLLTHVPPWNDPGEALHAAQSTFAGPAALATSGMVVTVGR